MAPKRNNPGPQRVKYSARDRKVQKQLEADGWNVIVVWECEISRKTDREERLERLENEIRHHNRKENKER